MEKSKKFIAITSGDMGSVSNVITLKAYLKLRYTKNKFFLISDANYVEKIVQNFKLNIKIKKIDNIEELEDDFHLSLTVLHITNNLNFELGKKNKDNAIFAINSLDSAILLTKLNKISGIVTNPLDKSLVALSINNFLGHTEYLANEFEVNKYGMMFMCPFNNTRGMLITSHIPLSKVCESINENLIIEKALLLNSFLNKYKKNPKILLGSLNPHAGENGLIGCEEINIINNARLKLIHAGIDISLPYPNDSIFYLYKEKKYDSILSFYHDSFLSGFKSLFMDNGVNVTIGLPIIRASVDHGTAFDKANDFQNAKESSLVNAIIMAKILTEGII